MFAGHRSGKPTFGRHVDREAPVTATPLTFAPGGEWPPDTGSGMVIRSDLRNASICRFGKNFRLIASVKMGNMASLGKAKTRGFLRDFLS
jgi:hypothetical protein